MKLVRLNRKEVSPLILVFREALFYGIPLMVLGYFFQIVGMIAWWGINAIFVLFTPRQQTLIDLVLKTMWVYEPDYDSVEVAEKAKKVKWNQNPSFKKK